MASNYSVLKHLNSVTGSANNRFFMNLTMKLQTRNYTFTIRTINFNKQTARTNVLKNTIQIIRKSNAKIAYMPEVPVEHAFRRKYASNAQ